MTQAHTRPTSAEVFSNLVAPPGAALGFITRQIQTALRENGVEQYTNEAAVREAARKIYDGVMIHRTELPEAGTALWNFSQRLAADLDTFERLGFTRETWTKITIAYPSLLYFNDSVEKHFEKDAAFLGRFGFEREATVRIAKLAPAAFFSNWGRSVQPIHGLEKSLRRPSPFLLLLATQEICLAGQVDAREMLLKYRQQLEQSTEQFLTRFLAAETGVPLELVREKKSKRVEAALLDDLLWGIAKSDWNRVTRDFRPVTPFHECMSVRHNMRDIFVNMAKDIAIAVERRYAGRGPSFSIFPSQGSRVGILKAIMPEFNLSRPEDRIKLAWGLHAAGIIAANPTARFATPENV